jgi:hypothetical protein
MPAKTTTRSEDLTNPYGYSEMDWAARLDPAYAAARAEVRRLSVGEDGTLSVKVITGCKFSVAQMLRSSAQIEGNRIRRERCAKKNAWGSEPA